MKYLKKANSQEEYKNYLQDYDSAAVTSRVSLVEGQLEFFDNSGLFYIEAISDITIPIRSMTFRDYSYDGENWIEYGSSIKKDLTIPSGCRVYLKEGHENSLLKHIIGTYKIGGNINTSDYKFTDALGLVEIKEDFVFNVYKGATYYNFSGCTNLVKAPKLIAPYSKPGNYQSVILTNVFKGCTSLTSAPIILINGLHTSNYGSFNLDNLFSGCSKLTSEIIVKVGTIVSGAAVTATNWLADVPLGTLVLSPALYKRLKDSYIPDGWKVLLSDIDSSERYIEFTLDGTAYKSDENMTWAQWAISEYNTIGLRVSGTSIINDLGTLYLGDTAVSSSDLVTCIMGTDYTIKTSTTK